MQPIPNGKWNAFGRQDKENKNLGKRVRRVTAGPPPYFWEEFVAVSRGKCPAGNCRAAAKRLWGERHGGPKDQRVPGQPGTAAAVLLGKSAAAVLFLLVHLAGAVGSRRLTQPARRDSESVGAVANRGALGNIHDLLAKRAFAPIPMTKNDQFLSSGEKTAWRNCLM